jgi:hypothetical protein
MTQENTNELIKYEYLCLEEAVQRVCDEELVHEMLIMLNSSIDNDWAEFGRYSSNNQYTSAANILHGMKGIIPIFTDKKTEEIILKTESLLLRPANEIELNKALQELRCQMLGFMSELKMWVKMQN